MEEVTITISESNLNRLLHQVNRYISLDKKIFNPQNAQAAAHAVWLFHDLIKNEADVDMYPEFKKINKL